MTYVQHIGETVGFADGDEVERFREHVSDSVLSQPSVVLPFHLFVVVFLFVFVFSGPFSVSVVRILN